MEQIILKIIESSVSAAVLVLVLWVFLPRLIKSMDQMGKSNTREHIAIFMLLTGIEKRMNWHEAKVFGVNPSTGNTDNERFQAARESFERANANIEKLEAELHQLFDGG